MALVTPSLTASQLIHVGSGLVFTDNKTVSLLTLGQELLLRWELGPSDTSNIHVPFGAL